MNQWMIGLKKYIGYVVMTILYMMNPRFDWEKNTQTTSTIFNAADRL